jgi:prephenate dehydratase
MKKKIKTLKKVIAYAGKRSQSGLAARERFPYLDLQGGTESFQEIIKVLCGSEALGILPIWNSHKGEIPKTEIINSIFEEKLKVQELWPKKIIFECHVKKGIKQGNIKKVISVDVAEDQCSNFIDMLKRKGATFHGYPSTKVALNGFLADNSFNAILNAPNQCDGKGLVKLKEDVSNPVNFTTFTLVGNVSQKLWKGRSWKSLRDNALPKKNIVFGIEMDIPKTGFSESQHSLFEQLTQDTKDLNQIAKVIFVVKREGGRCGILFESSLDFRKHENVSMDPDDEGIMPNITIKRNIGMTNRAYVNNCFDLFSKEFPSILKHDFVKHEGVNACFYACPSLNLFTHGFDSVVVEDVVKKIIDLSFHLIDNGIFCSQAQRIFFKKYKKRYYEKGVDFIRFITI